MKGFLLALAVLALAGCAATSQTDVKWGKKALHINCSGLTSSWEKCYAKATSSCSDKQYKVLARAGDDDAESGDYLFGINPAGYTSRSMIVMCK